MHFTNSLPQYQVYQDKHKGSWTISWFQGIKNNKIYKYKVIYLSHKFTEDTHSYFGLSCKLHINSSPVQHLNKLFLQTSSNTLFQDTWNKQVKTSLGKISWCRSKHLKEIDMWVFYQLKYNLQHYPLILSWKKGTPAIL